MGRRIVSGDRKGFTLIELLVVISIIGLIATVATVALRNARIRGRDGARLSDMKQLHTAMELCADGNNGSYTTPTACCTAFSGSTIQVYQCGSGGALVSTYLTGIADLKDPSNVTGNCTGSNTSPCEYTISNITANVYTIRFYLEGGAGQNKILTQTGIQ